MRQPPRSVGNTGWLWLKTTSTKRKSRWIVRFVARRKYVNGWLWRSWETGQAQACQTAPRHSGQGNMYPVLFQMSERIPDQSHLFCGENISAIDQLLTDELKATPPSIKTLKKEFPHTMVFKDEVLLAFSQDDIRLFSITLHYSSCHPLLWPRMYFVLLSKNIHHGKCGMQRENLAASTLSWCEYWLSNWI